MIPALIKIATAAASPKGNGPSIQIRIIAQNTSKTIRNLSAPGKFSYRNTVKNIFYRIFLP